MDGKKLDQPDADHKCQSSLASFGFGHEAGDIIGRQEGPLDKEVLSRSGIRANG